ncbi:MAG: 23S rRNA (uracil(1939)-C(5))-methyltransferase RlmD [Bacteroidales bacterium]|nr:23S rRNA (uracil(1939)-C(5))-methyltransferase RlmD [Bacteroidales bacterium]
MRKNQKRPIITDVELTDLAAEGKAIARINGKVLFVTGAIPGDIIDVQVTRKKTSFMEGYPIKFHKHSEIKIEAKCKHFGLCGGCKWQQLPYSKQLEYKQKQVNDSFERIGKVSSYEKLPVIASENEYFYRNKLEFTFSNWRWLTSEEVSSGKDFSDLDALGFHVPKKFDRVIDIEKCWLQPDPSNAIRNEIRDYAKKKSYGFFDLKKISGFLRTMSVRTSSTGEIMVIISFGEDNTEAREDLLNHVSNKFPEISSLQYVINKKLNDTILDQEIIVFKGRDYILEEMEGLKFKIGPKSFYQTNSAQAYELYKVAREFASLSGNEIVYDLYTGTGTIANFVASKCSKVIGIEYVPEAIEDAVVNSELNGITKTKFFSGDMREVLNTAFIAENGKPDVIITDPPRAGMHPDVIQTLIDIYAEKIVYISCNPATQARDIQMLSHFYSVKKIQPVDMFPHTHHIENVALLEKL